MATTPILPASGFFAFFEQRWVQIVIVEFEILWCVLLLNNFWPRFLWTGSLALFTGFTVFSILKGVMGEVSCGCFGVVQVNPWYTAIFDAILVGLLLACKPVLQNPKMKLNYIESLSFVITWFAIAVPVGFLLSVQPSQLESEGVIRGESSIVLLTPEDWLNHPFPLLKYITPSLVLEKDKWTLIFYRENCVKCHEVMKHFTSETESVGIVLERYYNLFATRSE
ncbi:MAG: hypothetical protein Q4C95_12665 [Planctomycetia bacterium]|nr:hypothetical protein [Planctomycetia bacterium]